MTSMALPLLVDGKVIGVLGIDISLKALQNLSIETQKRLFNGKGHVSIISPAGVLAGHTRDASLLGTKLDQAFAGEQVEILQALSANQAQLIPHKDNMLTLQSFLPIPNSKPWGFFLEVPEQALIGPALQLEADLDKMGQENATISLAIGLVAGVIGLILVWLAVLSVTRPILGVAAMLENIASGEGDLARRLEYSKQDELGELANWFNRFLDKLQPIISDAKKTVFDTRATADQSARIASQTSDGMQQQFREIDLVATALQEMSATAHEVASSAAQAANAAIAADRASQDGLTIISSTTSAIELLSSEMNLAVQDVENLAESSEKIGSVLEVIRSIAEQTNLLALNAAIEAARAGDAGRGFAVVADEVRSLARRTQDSVGEIRQVIESLQISTQEIVSIMHSSHRQAQGSVKQVQHAVAALQRINQEVSVITDMNLQIASAAEEQSSVSEEINRNVVSIRDVTESISEQADKSAKISQTLNALANYQQSLMEQFRV